MFATRPVTERRGLHPSGHAFVGSLFLIVTLRNDQHHHKVNEIRGVLFPPPFVGGVATSGN